MTSFSVAHENALRVVADERRLAAVHASGLLDSEVEEAFDRLTRLAVRLVRIPAAFVSLVDANRDFYKSACGFGEPLASSRQLEGPTFCHFAIRSAEPLVIPDTQADPVYREVPTVRSLGVAAYVGIPLVFDGQVIGALCAIDVAPRAWTADEVDTLRELAAVAVSEISLRAARVEAERFREEAEQLADMSAAARRELEEQAEELALARAGADAANRAKSDFLAAMSHDLRTPLNAIGGYAQLIEVGVFGPATEGQRDAVQRILRAQQHLLALIGDILHFAKAESAQVPLQLRPVALSSLCEPLDALIGKQAADRGVAYRCDLDAATDGTGGELLVLADTERVLRVLVNLLTNAIKFTDAGGSVIVKARRDGAWAEIVVRDTGRGIAAEHLERIFEPFVQVHGEPAAASSSASSDARASVGLGLATSRTIAQRMGGALTVESAPGTGSTFVLRLPTA